MVNNTPAATATTSTPSRTPGIGRVLVVVYAILALAAVGRSVFQIIDRFGEAPIAFSLSALSGLVYVVATVALVARGAAWYRIALVTISFELVGVIVVGTITTFAPWIIGLADNDPFGRTSTVWSSYGLGYLMIPLVLPVLGLLYLRRRRPSAV